MLAILIGISEQLAYPPARGLKARPLLASAPALRSLPSVTTTPAKLAYKARERAHFDAEHQFKIFERSKK